MYWLAVFLVSLALLVALVLFLESRDPTSVEGSGAVLLSGRYLRRPTRAGSRRTKRAKTTIRCAAL